MIGPDVQRQARPYFDMSPCAAVSLKGKAVPLTPYRIIQESGIRSRFEAARARGPKTTLGEARSWMYCKPVSRSADGYGQFVTIEGEPGMGKSRLLHEFLRTLDRQQFRIPQGRCQPLGSDTPYFPFLNALRRALALGEHDSRAEELNKATANIRQVDPSLEILSACPASPACHSKRFADPGAFDGRDSAACSGGGAGGRDHSGYHEPTHGARHRGLALERCGLAIRAPPFASPRSDPSANDRRVVSLWI